MGSRVANNPVQVPQGVEIKIDDTLVTVKGKKGQLTWEKPKMIEVTCEGNVIKFAAKSADQVASAKAGTARALISNMVIGVSEGFEKKLVLMGVGYRAQAQGNKLNLTVGLSHPCAIEMPEGITVETPSATEIVVKGMDKQRVSQVAANIRAVRPPEPYKGKGIRYAGEHVALKEGKKK